MKNYLEFEDERNKRNKKLYSDILKAAFGNVAVIGHHLCFNDGDDLDEIPSADCLIFDHDIMQKVFGIPYLSVITQLAVLPVGERDEMLSKLFYNRRGVQTPLYEELTA